MAFTPEQFETLAKRIEDVIQKKVNGKIDGLRNDFNLYVEQDTQWKEDAKPVIDMGKNINGFGKISKVILSLMVAIGSAWGLIEWISGKISNK
jgi:hypothetical protein